MNAPQSTAERTDRSYSPKPQEPIGDFQEVVDRIGSAVADCSRKHPAAAATVIFFVGFYVGWKVKPW